jgi:hypothetical protein
VQIASIVLAVVIVIVGAGMLFRSNTAIASDQNQIIQGMLVELTSSMKAYSEVSKVDFKYWADLNDQLLGHISSYYNENPNKRFTPTKSKISYAESRLKEISSSQDQKQQKEMLVNYISEFETNKSKHSEL